MLWKINRIAGFYLTYHGVFWLVAGNCNSHCSRRVLQPLATTQSATVYINIHSAAIASARETRRNGWLFCLVVSIRLFSKKALRFMNACRAHKSCFFFFSFFFFLKKGGTLKKKKKRKRWNRGILFCTCHILIAVSLIYVFMTRGEAFSKSTEYKTWNESVVFCWFHGGLCGLKWDRPKATPFFSTLDSAPHATRTCRTDLSPRAFDVVCSHLIKAAHTQRAEIF